MKKILSIGCLLIMFFLVVFTRSFAGIYFLDIRLGEYFVALGMLLAFSIFLIPNRYIETPLIIHNIFRIIIFAFLITLVVTDADFLSRYTYKTSSYIWTLSYLFIGYYFLKDTIDKRIFYAFFLGYLILYIFGTGNYPDVLINWFKDFGDKFTFVKASDMVLATIILNILAINTLEKRQSYLFFIFSVGIFIPLITQMSRGALIALFIFSTFYLVFNFKFIFFNFRNLLALFILGPIVFFASTFRVTQFDFSSLPKENLETVGLVSVVDEELDKITRIHDNTQIDTFMSLYFEQRYVPNVNYNTNPNVLVDTGWHNKLISTDGTFNWRLSMWQDLYYYQAAENKVLFGYGYNEVLPVFNLDYDSQNMFRVGHDKSNEHVHNYLVNIFGRGGLLQLTLFILIHLTMYLIYYRKYKNHFILMLIIPPLFNSMTDIAMEGVQFPINFYLIYGYLLSYGINLKEGKPSL